MYSTKNKYSKIAEEAAFVKKGNNEPFAKVGNNELLAKDYNWSGYNNEPLATRAN
jgi:hypothetical protein